MVELWGSMAGGKAGSCEACWSDPLPADWPPSGRRPCGGLALALPAAKPQEGALRHFHLVIQRSGAARVAHGSWEAELQAGDLALCEGEVPPSLKDAGSICLSFRLPVRAEIPCDIPGTLPAVLPGRHPASALLIHIAEALGQAQGNMAPSLAGRLVGGLLVMLAGALEAPPEAPAPMLPRLTRFHLERIKAYLREHARDPGLAVADVARALDMSVSHVHRVFAHEGCTVGDWLWARRLEACATELSSAAHAHRTVGEIALAWGFSDLSHFSRAFRKRFAVSPKEWRKQSPWRLPLSQP